MTDQEKLEQSIRELHASGTIQENAMAKHGVNCDTCGRFAFCYTRQDNEKICWKCLHQELK